MSKGVEIGPMEKSSFVKPYSIAYTLDGKKMRWDAVQSHPAVACVLVHRDTKSMLLVRQFRPAVRQVSRAAFGHPARSHLVHAPIRSDRPAGV